MKEFIVAYLTNFTDGQDFINLTNTCKDLNAYQNLYLKQAWKRGKVLNVKNAMYVNSLLKKYTVEVIIEEVPTKSIMKQTLSSFKALLNKRQKHQLTKLMACTTGYTLIPHETIVQAKLKLGKRKRTSI